MTLTEPGSLPRVRHEHALRCLRRMKLIIQIPCFNEAEQLPATLRDLPREGSGFDEVEWLIIDDGSRDETVKVARRCGVDHVVRLTNNKGLAAAFQAGLDASLKLGADVIVNTDADNQYRATSIPDLVQPILRGNADMVIGNRQVETIEHFSASKKRLQRLGSAVVRRASQTTVPDVTSGFRAYNREAALQVQVVSKFTYTLESIIQAGKMLVALEHVAVGTNRQTRESRLFPSTWAYVRRNAVAIFRVYTMYEPLRVFLMAAALATLIGAAVWIRFLYFFFSGEGHGHVQSLILGATMLVVAVQLAGLGILADVLAAIRLLLQRNLERVRRLELQLGVEPSHYEPGAAPTGQRATMGAAAGPAGRPSESAEPEGRRPLLWAGRRDPLGRDRNDRADHVHVLLACEPFALGLGLRRHHLALVRRLHHGLRSLPAGRAAARAHDRPPRGKGPGRPRAPTGRGHHPARARGAWTARDTRVRRKRDALLGLLRRRHWLCRKLLRPRLSGREATIRALRGTHAVRVDRSLVLRARRCNRHRLAAGGRGARDRCGADRLARRSPWALCAAALPPAHGLA